MTVIEGKVLDQGGRVFNVKAYAAKGNTLIKTGATIASGSTALTASSATFASGDVGKLITVQGAGALGAVLSTTISAYTDATHVTLAAAALTSVTNAEFAFGTDDTAAIVAAVNAAGPSSTLFVPPGIYFVKGSSNGGGPIKVQNSSGRPGAQLFGAGGRCVPDVSAAATVFLCADANAGIFANGWSMFQGFCVHGNNIATAPLVQGELTGNIVTNGASFGTLIDVWSTASAGTGWSVYGCQNHRYFDCGTTNNAVDGVHLDGGAGGLDFRRFTESGSKRYGVRGDIEQLGAGGYVAGTGNNHFFGGTITSAAGGPSGVSKIFIKAGYDWKFHGTRILGDNLTGPTVDLDQTAVNTPTAEGGHGLEFVGCTITATPTGASPGRACVRLSNVPTETNPYTFVKLDGIRFLTGDSSVYVSAAAGFRHWAIGWVVDATTYGVVGAATIQGVDSLLRGRTGPWYSATLSAPWSGTIAYRVRADGLIELKGSATCSNATGGTMFTLPAGYRPNSGSGSAIRVPVSRSDVVDYLAITSAGVVSSTSSAIGMVVHVDGVTFPQD